MHFVQPTQRGQNSDERPFHFNFEHFEGPNYRHFFKDFLGA
jgi:hypothetical protein